jgi:hypothetical protein
VDKIMPNESTHQELIKNPSIRQALFKQFAPTFLFHKDEDNFPVDPDTAIENIITVKRDEYLHIQERQGRGLTKKEQTELDAINEFFWVNGGFNRNYKKFQNNERLIKLTSKGSSLLVFDEKHYGYEVGQKIDVTGIAPKGHKHYDKDKRQAPITTSIIPTEDGFFIQYGYLYSLNNAISGTRWLRRLLPEWLCKKLGNFGFHYGDAEGVGIHVTMKDGVASFKSMQTWAHGRTYAENVMASDCTFDEHGHVSVFVGLGGHPSYAHKFVGRNLPMDLVGDTYKIAPKEFIDVSPDVIKLASVLAEKDLKAKQLALFTEENPLVESAIAVPGSLSVLRRFADSKPIAHHGIKDEQHLNKQFKGYNNYHPWLLLARIKNFILSFFYENNSTPPQSLNVTALLKTPLTNPVDGVPDEQVNNNSVLAAKSTATDNIPHVSRNRFFLPADKEEPPTKDPSPPTKGF